MTGEKLLNKVQNMSNILDVQWIIEGEFLDPSRVKVQITTESENLLIEYPRPGSNNFIQYAALAMAINKSLELMGDEVRFNIGDDLSSAVNYVRSKINNKKG